MPRKEIDFTKIYESNMYGPFIIVNEEPYIRVGANNTVQRRVRIRFINTGTERIVNLGCALNGSVMDPYARTVHGVGYWGVIKENGIMGVHYTKREYDMWFHMIERCYCTTCNAYPNYGGKGVTVDPRWHSFTNFIMDLPTLLGYNEYINSSEEEKTNYHLDKDFLQKNVPHNQRVYSKDTCILIKAACNSRLAARDSKEGTSSPYFGVYRNPGGKSFQASIMLDNTKYFLGTFDDEIAAATVYNFVASRCAFSPTINSDIAPYMDINVALSHRTSRKPLVLPPQIDASLFNLNLNPTHKSSIYVGVEKRNNTQEPRFTALYCVDKVSHLIGTFDDEIAAANAHNYYANMYNPDNSTINQVPYMSAAEWLSHKVYAINEKKPIEMCRIVNKG
jgi:hypothetical protein